MALPFPTDEPFLKGYYAPLHLACDADNLPVTGELPAGLNGWLYRNGPNPQFGPRGPYHWFAGDGMRHAFHVEDGRVAYRNRWVRTPKWQLEHAEGQGLSGSLGNPRYSDPRFVALNATVANTDVVWHRGRLLALEEAHAPFEVDPVTLAPRGSHDFGGQLVGLMTAHPKLDAVNGEPVFVPRSADAAEGDGWLLSVIVRAETQCSDLAVFDAGPIEQGPLAMAHLSHRVPAGFHGNWRGSDGGA